MIADAKNFALTKRLVFPWPRRYEHDLLLPAMIGVALIFHISALTLVQLIYPEATAGEPPSARVLVPGPKTPGWQSAKVWIDAADPSIFAPIRPEEPLNVLQSPRAFTPSYMQRCLQLRLPEDSFLELAELRTLQLPPVLTSGNASAPSSEPLVQTTELVAQLAVNGAPGRSIPLGHELSEKIHSPPIPSAVFLIHLGEDGSVRNLFLQSSSGFPEWDFAASDIVRREKFDPAFNSFSWAWVSVQLEKSTAAKHPDSATPTLQP